MNPLSSVIPEKMKMTIHHWKFYHVVVAREAELLREIEELKGKNGTNKRKAA